MDTHPPIQSPFRKFEEILLSYPNMLQKYSGEKPIIGFFTPRIPLEVLHALNFYPVRLLPAQMKNMASKMRSGSFVQGFCCSWLRTIFDQTFEEVFNFDLLIFDANTCDSLQNMSDIWRHTFPKQHIYSLNHPIRHDEPLATAFFTQELKKMINFLLRNSPGLSFNETKLRKSIELYNTKRALLSEAMSLVTKSQLNYTELFITSLVGDIIPIERYIPMLRTQYDYWRNQNLASDPEKCRLIISGGKLDNFRFFKLFETLKAQIVADDLGFGSRSFFSIPTPSTGLIEAVSSTYLKKIPESTQFDVINKRNNYLIELVNKHNAEGIIYTYQKFCDPDAFESIAIKEFLQEKEIPCLILELDSQLSNIEQLKTRLEAFIEIIRG